MEIPDSAIEAELSKLGKKLVDASDYTKKAEAALDLAKFRKATGDGRSIEEIETIIKAHEESAKKNQTQTELLTSELKRLQNQMLEKEGEIKRRDQELRKRDVKQYFEQAMQATGIKVIEPILEQFRSEFYDMDETGKTPEQVKELVTQTLARAQEVQKGELLRLGINGVSPNPQNPSFGGGITNFDVKPAAGVQFTPNNPSTMFDIMRETSASPMGVPLTRPQTK